MARFLKFIFITADTFFPLAQYKLKYSITFSPKSDNQLSSNLNELSYYYFIFLKRTT